MRSLIVLIPLLMLCGSCALKQKAEATFDDLKVVAGRVKEISDQIPAIKADVDKRINDAENKARLAGLNVDGTEEDFLESVKKNPGKSWSAGLGTLAMAAFGVWQRNRIKRQGNALAAVVDSIDTLPADKPINKTEILDEIARHPRMDVGAKLETTAVKTR